MTNYCENTLRIDGTNENINFFEQVAFGPSYYLDYVKLFQKMYMAHRAGFLKSNDFELFYELVLNGDVHLTADIFEEISLIYKNSNIAGKAWGNIPQRYKQEMKATFNEDIKPSLLCIKAQMEIISPLEQWSDISLWWFTVDSGLINKGRLINPLDLSNIFALNLLVFISNNASNLRYEHFGVEYQIVEAESESMNCMADTQSLTINFFTDWNPPRKQFAQEIAGLFEVRIEHTHKELGNAIAGCLVFDEKCNKLVDVVDIITFTEEDDDELTPIAPSYII